MSARANTPTCPASRPCPILSLDQISDLLRFTCRRLSAPPCLMWDDARLYEWETATIPPTCATGWRRSTYYTPRRVLELACGTGRLALPLAAAGVQATPGFRMVGLDHSPALLARAAEKLAAAPDLPPGSVTLVEGGDGSV